MKKYFNQISCRKCGSKSFFTEIKGANTGLYCSDCGAWIKWLSEDELRVFNHTHVRMKPFTEKERKSIHEYIQDTSQPLCFFQTNEKTIKERLMDYVDYISMAIEIEYNNPMASKETHIMRLLDLNRARKSLLNILNNKDFNYIENENLSLTDGFDIDKNYVEELLKNSKD